VVIVDRKDLSPSCERQADDQGDGRLPRPSSSARLRERHERACCESALMLLQMLGVNLDRVVVDLCGPRVRLGFAAKHLGKGQDPVPDRLAALPRARTPAREPPARAPAADGLEPRHPDHGPEPRHPDHRPEPRHLDHRPEPRHPDHGPEPRQPDPHRSYLAGSHRSRARSAFAPFRPQWHTKSEFHCSTPGSS
jgi:hypothetical protein